MNKFDKIYCGFVIVLAVTLFGVSKIVATAISVDEAMAVVYHNDKEVLRLPMNQDGRFSVNGTLGDVVLEIKDGRIRVADEISPLHYCQVQGWVERTNVPIVCLPNGIKIVIESDDSLIDPDDGDITVG
ncbi:hypothetical protein AOC36_09820 [Erysipelothrix larvae]|uniref:Uncharacterized protein n=1 Tax=Erysipelothrix larvae TaxID=1514105 RepID=A0A0X8H1I9_9FIRM|nr:NusG domain II-containing protein [Erysipelothrix larvae]AMC94264.1 hypothetical protein AOC36_09820 [Erysipelothrix larvae]